MVFSKKSNAKAIVWALVPLFVALIVGMIYGAPYSSISGFATLGLLALIYKDIGEKKYEIFKAYALPIAFFLAMSIGGWADQGIH